VGERPGVEVLADLADELAVGPEFVELRRRIGEAGPWLEPPREKTKTWPSNDGDAGRLAEMDVGGSFR